MKKEENLKREEEFRLCVSRVKFFWEAILENRSKIEDDGDDLKVFFISTIDL
jgi:hypothetical protein